MIVNVKIKDLLNEKGKSIYWLSKQTNISHQNLTKLIKNDTISIRFEHIGRICKALECTPNDIFEVIEK
jgi:putative transcriptional regulator